MSISSDRLEKAIKCDRTNIDYFRKHFLLGGAPINLRNFYLCKEDLIKHQHELEEEVLREKDPNDGKIR